MLVMSVIPHAHQVLPPMLVPPPDTIFCNVLRARASEQKEIVKNLAIPYHEGRVKERVYTHFLSIVIRIL